MNADSQHVKHLFEGFRGGPTHKSMVDRQWQKMLAPDLVADPNKWLKFSEDDQKRFPAEYRKEFTRIAKSKVSQEEKIQLMKDEMVSLSLLDMKHHSSMIGK